MMKVIFGELPEWAKRSNPLLRYELVRSEGSTEPRARAMRIGGWALLLAMFGLGGYLYATEGLTRSFQMPYTLDIWRALFFPLLILQVIMRVAGLSMAMGAVTEERRRQTWDNLRSTEMGIELSLRTRWVSILFYRLRPMLFAIILSRIILIGGILYELTAMQGEYLRILSNRAVPGVPFEMSIVLLAAMMTAFILLPITATGVDIAIGLLIGSRVKNRAYAGILQTLLVIFRVGTAIVLLWLTLRYMLQFQAGAATSNGSLLWLMDLFNTSELALEGSAALGLLASFSVFGDWGLLISQLTRAGELWAEIPYSIFIGVGLLALALVQILISEGLLRLATRFAEHNE